MDAPPTSFIGRSEELELLRQSFAQGARLVTLLGPPGIGKTRLALRFVELAKDFAGGIFVVDLTEASSAEDMCAAVGLAIGTPVEGSDLAASLERLGDALVILDPMERLAVIASQTIGRWLRQTKRLVMLVASQVRLRLAGEVVHEIGPLPHDDSAIQLFVARARAARPGFIVTAENQPSIVELVRELDGIPLALELGASRMGLLSPAELLAMLPRRLDVLSATIRDHGVRQGTLREAISAAFELLEPWEKRALEQLSVFRGGFDLRAAQAVVDRPAIDVLAALSDKSFVYKRGSRFDLYLSIRDFAAERLEASGAGEATRLRHAAHYLEGESSELERANLLVAHTTLLQCDRHEDALRIALSLEPILLRWGPVTTLVSMIDDAMRAQIAPAWRRRALVVRARAAHRLGRLEEARRGFDGALAAARRARDARLEGMAAAGVGEVLRELGRLDLAERRLQNGIAALANAGEHRLEARARIALSHVHTISGRHDAARVELERALRLVAGDPELEANVRASLGIEAIAVARLEEAEEHLIRARGCLAPLPPTIDASILSSLSFLRAEQGRLPEALASAEAALAVARQLGNRRQQGFFESQVGLVHAESGDLDLARVALERGSALLREAGDARADGLFTAALAVVLSRLGQRAEAQRQLAWIDEQLSEVSDPLRTAIELYKSEVEDGPRSTRASTQAARSHHVRIALRIVAPKSKRIAGGALVVSPDARWCRLPDGREILFQRSRPQRLMLLRLLEERLSVPGHALPVGALFESGWPGERAAPASAQNRVYVGISRLRKRGLRGVLLSRDDGFLLDPGVAVYRAERPLQASS